MTRSGLKGRRRIFYSPCQRTRVIDTLVRPKPDPEMGQQPEGGLVSDDAGVGSRNTDRAALITAERDVHLACGHGRCGSRRRSAGHVIVVMGVEGPSVVADAASGAEAATQSVHDVLADDCAPLLQHSIDYCGVEVGDESFQGERAKTHWDTRNSDVVLVAGGLTSKETIGFPFDPALPHPGV